MAKKNAQKVDEALVRRFANGEMKAFDSIYALFNRKLHKFIFSLIKRETDTDDIVQEVFVKVWENRGRLTNFGSFDSYLFTTAYHTTISLLRSRIRETHYVEYVKSIQIELSDNCHQEEFNCIEMEEKINQLIELMPPRQREVFKLRHIESLSYKKIAQNLGLSVNTVENHIVNSHKFLKKNLGESYLPVLFFMHLFSAQAPSFFQFVGSHIPV